MNANVLKIQNSFHNNPEIMLLNVKQTSKNNNNNKIFHFIRKQKKMLLKCLTQVLMVKLKFIYIYTCKHVKNYVFYIHVQYTYIRIC